MKFYHVLYVYVSNFLYLDNDKDYKVSNKYSLQQVKHNK